MEGAKESNLHQQATVTRVERFVAQGMFAPLTEGGEIVVDGVLCSWCSGGAKQGTCRFTREILQGDFQGLQKYF